MILGHKPKNHYQQTRKRGALDRVDDRGTPPDLFATLNSVHRFTLDAAASAENAKCAKFFTLEQNGLAQSWSGETVWCNPPYSSIIHWVKKAGAETNYGCPKVVMLLPNNRCEQAWWCDYIEPFRDLPRGRIKTEFLPRRRRFVWPQGQEKDAHSDRPPFGLVLVMFTANK